MLKIKIAIALLLLALMVFPAVMVIKARLRRGRRDEAPPPGA